MSVEAQQAHPPVIPVTDTRDITSTRTIADVIPEEDQGYWSKIVAVNSISSNAPEVEIFDLTVGDWACLNFTGVQTGDQISTTPPHNSTNPDDRDTPIYIVPSGDFIVTTPDDTSVCVQATELDDTAYDVNVRRDEVQIASFPVIIEPEPRGHFTALGMEPSVDGYLPKDQDFEVFFEGAVDDSLGSGDLTAQVKTTFTPKEDGCDPSDTKTVLPVASRDFNVRVPIGSEEAPCQGVQFAQVSIFERDREQHIVETIQGSVSAGVGTRPPPKHWWDGVAFLPSVISQ